MHKIYNQGVPSFSQPTFVEYLVCFITANDQVGFNLLKCNKCLCILSIAVTTLLYIAHVCLGSDHNSYQGHVNDSG